MSGQQLIRQLTGDNLFGSQQTVTGYPGTADNYRPWDNHRCYLRQPLMAARTATQLTCSSMATEGTACWYHHFLSINSLCPWLGSSAAFLVKLHHTNHYPREQGRVAVQRLICAQQIYRLFSMECQSGYYEAHQRPEYASTSTTLQTHPSLFMVPST